MDIVSIYCSSTNAQLVTYLGAHGARPPVEDARHVGQWPTTIGSEAFEPGLCSFKKLSGEILERRSREVAVAAVECTSCGTENSRPVVP